MFMNRNVLHAVCFPKQLKKVHESQSRNVQISVIGAASNIGSNLSVLLKQNPKISRLQLYDDDERVQGLGLELNYIPGGPSISCFSGDSHLFPAIQFSSLIVMVSRFPRKPGNSREQMLEANAPAVQKVCRAVAEHNPDTFLAISSSPINSIVPFASVLMQKYSCFNPFKLFGITHIDSARCRCFAAQSLNVNQRYLCMPVIGGHSEETMVPLFSNLVPTCYCIDPTQADTLTRLVRKSGTHVINLKQGSDSSTLAMAWSVHEFIDLILDAICGNQVTVNSLVANPHFGTRFFSGPTTVGPSGIMQTCAEYPMNEYESYLLNCAVPMINRDVHLGEDYVRYMEEYGKRPLR